MRNLVSDLSRPPRLDQIKPLTDWKSKVSHWIENSTAQPQSTLQEVLDVMSPTQSPIRHVNLPSAQGELNKYGFELEKIIGQGSYSKVRLATHTLTKNKVLGLI